MNTPDKRPAYVADCLTPEYLGATRFGTLSADDALELLAVAAGHRLTPAAGVRVLIRWDWPSGTVWQDLAVVAFRNDSPMVMESESLMTLEEFTYAECTVEAALYHPADMTTAPDGTTLSGAESARQRLQRPPSSATTP